MDNNQPSRGGFLNFPPVEVFRPAEKVEADIVRPLISRFDLNGRAGGASLQRIN